MPTHSSQSAVRLDKWLWAARFFKTRSLAAAAIESGRVRQDGEKVKPARSVQPGQILQIDNGSTRWEVAVLALSETRGSATVAQTLYAETEASVQRRAQEAEQRRLAPEPALARQGRPTRQDRQAIERALFEKNTLE